MLPESVHSFETMRIGVQFDPLRVTVDLDDIQIGDVKLKDQLQGLKPTALLMTGHSDSIPFRFRNLRIIPGTVGRSDQLWLKDGTTLAGAFLAWTQEGVRVRDADETEVLVSLDQVSSLWFARRSRNRPKRDSRDVEVWMKDGVSRIRLRLQDLKEGMLTGDHGNWQEGVKLPLSTVSRIRWNPHTLLPEVPRGRLEPLPGLFRGDVRQ
jgi:hypothetical protein